MHHVLKICCSEGVLFAHQVGTSMVHVSRSGMPLKIPEADWDQMTADVCWSRVFRITGSSILIWMTGWCCMLVCRVTLGRLLCRPEIILLRYLIFSCVQWRMFSIVFQRTRWFSAQVHWRGVPWHQCVSQVGALLTNHFTEPKTGRQCTRGTNHSVLGDREKIRSTQQAQNTTYCECSGSACEDAFKLKPLHDL